MVTKYRQVYLIQSLADILYFCVGEQADYGFDQQRLIYICMACFSPVGCGV